MATIVLHGISNDITHSCQIGQVPNKKQSRFIPYILCISTQGALSAAAAFKVRAQSRLPALSALSRYDETFPLRAFQPAVLTVRVAITAQSERRENAYGGKKMIG